MGSRAVEDLAASSDVEKVTIADRDTDGAERVISGLPQRSADVLVERVDAMDHEALVEAIGDHDLAASALGPFYQFESRLVRAAVEAGTDYVSICDDWSATLDVFMRFDQPARERGLTVITGCGASPGLSNMGVKYLSEGLDETRDVDIYVFVPMDSSEGVATIKHTLFVYGITVPVYRDGALEMLPAGAESRVVEFPSFGEVRVWNVGHSEPVTIPRFLPGVGNINMMMGLGRGTGALVAAGRLGLFKSPRRRDLISRMAARTMKPEAPSSAEGAIRIDVSGMKSGRPATLTACGTATMKDATGLSLSVGAILLGKGRLTERDGGVFAPEGCLDAMEFIDLMEHRGVRVYSDIEMTEKLTQGPPST